MTGYGRGKIILRFPLFCRLNEEKQERENSKHQIKTKTFLFSFDFEFEFPALEVPRCIIQKGSNFKIIFLVPYPIIYNPAMYYLPIFK